MMIKTKTLLRDQNTQRTNTLKYSKILQSFRR